MKKPDCFIEVWKGSKGIIYYGSNKDPKKSIPISSFTEDRFTIAIFKIYLKK